MTKLQNTVSDYSDNVMNTYGRYPMTISHGKGCKLYDTDGKEYLDMAAGIATCCLGHSHPALKKAVSDQMDKVHHCSNLYFIPEQAALAKWLVHNSCADKAFFCNSGAEANEAAIKLARKYAHTKLNIDFPVIITAVNSFHGRTLTAITATGQPKYQKDFGPLTPGFEYVDYNNLEQLREKVKSVQAAGNGHGLAAIMMEALQGEGGIRPGDAAFFKGIREICDSTGALMIVDEVQTGMGRTGKLWGYENLGGVEPDCFTSAKALGGGVPIGAMLCKEKFNVFGPGDHASTYGGNPLACAAGIAVTQTFEKENILANVLARGEQVRDVVSPPRALRICILLAEFHRHHFLRFFLVYHLFYHSFTQLRTLARELQKRKPEFISDIRGWGLIVGVEIAPDCPAAAADVAKALLAAGVLVVPAGPKVVRFVPPLIVTEEEVKTAFVKFEEALTALSKPGALPAVNA
jgi:acetylornithine aminotransferase